MTTDPVIRQLTKERDSMVQQIARRRQEIARFSDRLKDSLMPNQKAILQAQRTRQITMLDVDQNLLITLEQSLATEIANRP